MTCTITPYIETIKQNGRDDRYYSAFLVYSFDHVNQPEQIPFLPIYELNSTLIKTKLTPLSALKITMSLQDTVTTIKIKITLHTAQEWEYLNNCLDSITSAFFTADDTIIKTHNFE